MFKIFVVALMLFVSFNAFSQDLTPNKSPVIVSFAIHNKTGMIVEKMAAATQDSVPLVSDVSYDDNTSEDNTLSYRLTPQMVDGQMTLSYTIEKDGESGTKTVNGHTMLKNGRAEITLDANTIIDVAAVTPSTLADNM